MTLGPPQFSLQLALLGAASLTLYFAGRFAMNVIPARVDRAAVRAWLAAMPVVLVSLMAIACDRPQVGLHLPIACAAAALTFGLGVVIAGRPAPQNAEGSRSWPLVLPAVTMVSLIALAGAFGAAAIATLGAFGALALAGWRNDPPRDDGADPPTRPRRDAYTAVGVWTAAAVASVVAGALAAVGLPALEALRQMPSDALATVFLLAPAIVVPMCFELLPPCRPIGWQASVSTVSKFALICLAVALPLAALAAAARPAIATYYGLTGVKRIATAPTTAPAAPPLFATSQPATGPATQPTTAPTREAATLGPLTLRYVRLPAVPQRADLLVIAAAALLLLPMSLGHFRPGRLESAALIGCYLFYLVLVMRLVMR